LVRSNLSPVDGARDPSAEVQAPHCWPLYGLVELQSRETLLAHLYLVVLVLLHVEALRTERLHRALLSGEGRGTHFGPARTRSSSRARFAHKRAIAYETLPPIVYISSVAPQSSIATLPVRRPSPPTRSGTLASENCTVARKSPYPGPNSVIISRLAHFLSLSVHPHGYLDECIVVVRAFLRDIITVMLICSSIC
jgi:hypothetical protein